MGDHVGTPDVEFLFLFLFASPEVVVCLSVCVDFCCGCVFLACFLRLASYFFAASRVKASEQVSKRASKESKQRNEPFKTTNNNTFH